VVVVEFQENSLL